jgi:hypothetical protein
MSSVRVLVGTKKGALILTKQEILDSKADPGLPAYFTPAWHHSIVGQQKNSYL